MAASLAFTGLVEAAPLSTSQEFLQTPQQLALLEQKRQAARERAIEETFRRLSGLFSVDPFGESYPTLDTQHLVRIVYSSKF